MLMFDLPGAGMVISLLIETGCWKIKEIRSERFRGKKTILKKCAIRGFSMVEVLLALSIGGLVLLAASALLVTISQAWANRPATLMHLMPISMGYLIF